MTSVGTCPVCGSLFVRPQSHLVKRFCSSTCGERERKGRTGTRTRVALPAIVKRLPLPVVAPDPDWWEQSVCKGVNPDLFFPTRGESSDPAKAVCARCPVDVECLQQALVDREVHGVWGGTSEKERREIRRRVAIRRTPLEEAS